MDLIELDHEQITVRFRREGVMLDLGSIGKGYALERAADLLRDAGITSAVLHGGTSTVCAIGAPPGQPAWRIGIEDPRITSDAESTLRIGDDATHAAPRHLLATVPLKNESLSVSAVWGKSFEVAGKTYGHVIDPRTGWPVNDAVLAAVVLPSATESDAFSTALLTLGRSGLEKISRLRPASRMLVLASRSNENQTVVVRGIELNETHR